MLGRLRAGLLARGAPLTTAGLVLVLRVLVDRGSVEVLGARLVRLLRAAVAEPDRALSSLPVLSADERGTIG